MRAIHPTLFAKVMQLPDPKRANLLEYLGAMPVCARQLEVLIEEARERCASIHPNE